jgi:hypothetical protein
VVRELLSGEGSTRLEGAAAIDVPALLDREYRLNLYSFTQVSGTYQGCLGACVSLADLHQLAANSSSSHAHTQGLTHARVTFKNEATGEFTFYEVRLTSSRPAPIGRLSLECPVRNQTSACISITNPLSVPVALKATISNKQVRKRALVLQPCDTQHQQLSRLHRPPHTHTHACR